MPFTPTNMLNSPTDRSYSCNSFLSRFDKFSEGQIKQMFHKANACDIPILTKKINDKVLEVKSKHFCILCDPIDLFDELHEFIKELLVEYDEIGIKETYDKIKKIYSFLEYHANKQEDFRIVREIKKEYIETKKIAKSTMMYLNKIYKESKKEKENVKKEIEEMEKQGNKIW